MIDAYCLIIAYIRARIFAHFVSKECQSLTESD